MYLAVRELKNLKGVGGERELFDEEQILLGDRVVEDRMGIMCRTKGRY